MLSTELVEEFVIWFKRYITKKGSYIDFLSKEYK